MDNISKFDSDIFLFYFNKTIESKCMNICIKEEENSKELECLKKCFRSYNNIKSFYIKNSIYK